MIAHIQPVADIHSIAVKGHGFPSQNALDNHRDELLRELIRAVIVRAIRNDRRQSIGVMIGAHEHVTGWLAGGVGRVWSIWRRFNKESLRAEASINLIGRNVVKADTCV